MISWIRAILITSVVALCFAGFIALFFVWPVSTFIISMMVLFAVIVVMVREEIK